MPCFVFGLGARADLDLSTRAYYRSYPLSGFVEASSGYGLLLYGSAGSPFSGYIRPAIEGAVTSGYYSSLAKLEFFPLAIMGVRGGVESVHNDADYSAFDCTVADCKGQFHRGFLESELTLGAGPLFVQGRWRREHWTQNTARVGEFVEPTSGLLMTNEGEYQTVWQGIGGVKFDPAWSFMGGLRYAEGESGVSRLSFGFLRWHHEGFTLAVGGGAFDSELKKREATILTYFTWDIIPSLALK